MSASRILAMKTFLAYMCYIGMDYTYNLMTFLQDGKLAFLVYVIYKLLRVLPLLAPCTLRKHCIFSLTPVITMGLHGIISSSTNVTWDGLDSGKNGRYPTGWDGYSSRMNWNSPLIL